MQDGDREDYVLKIVCDGMSILIPLSTVGMILAADDKELQRTADGKTEWQGRELPVYSLAQLLNRDMSKNNRYVILLQNEDMEAALYVENVSEVLRTDFSRYELPCYLPEYITRDILGCYDLGNHEIAYEIDIMNIIKRFYALQEEEI